MLSEPVKNELIKSTKQSIETYGLEAIAKAAPHFVEMARIISSRPGCPESMREIHREYTENREEVNQIIAGLLGMM